MIPRPGGGSAICAIQGIGFTDKKDMPMSTTDTLTATSVELTHNLPLLKIYPDLTISG
ncbi:hypothetical protein NUACC21_52300 [Scytonema sp. NUACC21]